MNYSAMSDRQKRRLIRKILDRGGDRCAACGTPHRHGTVTVVGALADGTACEVGRCCSDKLVSVYAVGVYGEGPIPDVLRSWGRL